MSGCDDGTRAARPHRRRLHLAAACRRAADAAALAQALLPPIARPLPRSTCREDHPRDVYGYDLLLLRPDLHVVWRGNRLSSVDPGQLAALATGHIPSTW